MDLLHTAHVPPGEGPFPTVLALHGWGASAHDLIGLAPLLYRGGALVICPEGPVTVPVGPDMDGHGWFPLSGGGPPDPLVFEKALTALCEFTDQALERYGADRKKVVLLGFSQGGVMAYQLFLRSSELFAGMVALSSWLPAHVLDEVPETKLDRPVLVMHGTRDPMISVERARDSRKLLLDRGVPLTYREYEMGHEIAPEALRDLVEWLDDKVFEPILLA